MKTHALGNTGISCSRLGLGCMGFAGVYGDVDLKAVQRAVHVALDEGIDFFDTADVYGSGRSEQLLGAALSGKRDKAIIATKFGNIDHAGSEPKSELYANRFETCGRPEYVKQACDKSLVNLGVETIDLYYVHRIDPNVPIEETIGAMSELVDAGKIRSIGLSEASPATIRRAHKIHAVAALQSEYSLWSRDVEVEILALCKELGISFVAYSPLGRGFLSGEVPRVESLSAEDWRRHQPRFQAENYERNLLLIGHLDKMALARGCTKAQLALAWLLAQDESVFAIPGSKSARHLPDNAAATNLELTRAELDELDKAFPAGIAAGNRYPELQMKRLDS